MNEIEIVITGDDRAGSAFKGAKKAVDDFTDHVRKAGDKGGEVIGKGLNNGIIGAMKSLGGSPQLLAGIAAIGAAAAPALGATVSAALIGGVGIGGVIGAVSLLKDDARIKAAGSGLAENLLSTLRDAAEPSINPLLAAISKVDSRVGDLGGSFERIFSASTGALDGLLDPLLDGAEDLIDAFGDVSGAIDPVFEALGGAGKEILGAVADGLRSLSDNGTEAGAVIEAIGKSFALGIDVIFSFVNAMTEVYGWTLRVRSALGDDGATEALEKFKQEAQAAGEGSQQAGEGLTYLAEATDEEKKAAEDAAEAIRDMNDQIYRTAELNISAAESELRFKDALDAAAKAVDDKAGVSRKEERALLDIASASNNVTGKMYDQGASAEDLADKTDAARREFIKAARQMGYNASQAERLADKYLAIPENVKTRLEVINATQTGINAVRNALAKIPREIFTTVYTNRLDKGRAHGGITGVENSAATGGARGGMTWVGEQGPELVQLPFGSTVYPAGQSKAMAERAAFGGSDAGGRTVIELSPRVGAEGILMRAVVEAVQFWVRTQGRGDVNSLAGV